MAGPLDKMVTHHFVKINGITLHYVEAGSGPTVVMLHGFPDFWYSFRHQIPVLVGAGFHVVVPDARGFGQSDKPESYDEYTSLHVVGDLIGLLDFLQVNQAIFVGHDKGCLESYSMLLCRPDRVKGLILLGIPYFPRSPLQPNLHKIHKCFGDDVYLWVFQKPGVAEAMFEKAKNQDIMSAFLLRWASCPKLTVPKFIADEPLPDWLTKEELQTYAENFDKTGWTGGFNYYRALDLDWKLRAPWTNAILPPNTPVLTIVGKTDFTSKFLPIDSPGFVDTYRKFVPNMKGMHVLDGSHFVHQENSKEVNKYLLDFLQEFKKNGKSL